MDYSLFLKDVELNGYKLSLRFLARIKFLSYVSLCNFPEKGDYSDFDDISS